MLNISIPNKGSDTIIVLKGKAFKFYININKASIVVKNMALLIDGCSFNVLRKQNELNMICRLI